MQVAACFWLLDLSKDSMQVDTTSPTKQEPL